MPTLKIVPTFILLAGFCANTYSQTVTQTASLKRAATEQAAKEKILAAELQRMAKVKNWPLVFKSKNGGLAALTGIDAQGYPIYTSTENNILAAATIGTNKLWPGGGTGLNLSGSSVSVKGKLGLWDGGSARPTHVELTGRINNKNNVSVNDHTTHVAGTLMATGVNPKAKGMAFGLQQLIVYDFFNDLSEMLTESNNGMLISNHSYGTVSGWYNTGSRWEFRGQWGANEDYKFGFYTEETESWDALAYDAPYRLIVKSAGNNRNQVGPAVGASYWRYNASGQMIDAGTRPAGMSSNDGYDIIPTYGTAKNILTIGAIEPIPSGYSRAQDVKISSFSSWGPTDDGRIKPDVVSDGVDLFSSVGSSDNAYAIYSGTSMASPAAAGSLLLLQEYYAQLHGGIFMRSATLKALAIHTADEAGPAVGPDYKHGWGVINMGKSANVITAANTGNSELIREDVLVNGQVANIPVIASGKGPLIVTLCWTDPKGKARVIKIDNDTLQLVHDLDIRITKGATTYMPWILNPASPDDAATTGDNFRDNVEKIEVSDIVPGETYTITISHKNALTTASQAYSLIVSGVGGVLRCESIASFTEGARIDSVSFGNIQKQNAAGCIGYRDFTNLIAKVELNSNVPLYIKVNTCNGSTVNKVVKAFIDFNNDGDFFDAGESIASSGVITNDGTLTPTVAIPANVTPGHYTILRVVVEETSNAADVEPCGSYLKGETQDYRIQFVDPSNDVGITGIVSPLGTGCANASQYVTIRFRNYGTAAKSNIALSGSVKEGTTEVISLSGTYVPSVAASGEVEYTFQTPFAAVPGKTYTITVKATIANDQNSTNNEKSATMVVNMQQTALTAQAEICNDAIALLKATNAGSDIVLWYDGATATNPIAVGATASTTQKLATYYVGRNDLTASAGPANKMAFTEGAYATNNNHFMKFSTSVPLTIESAKLYIGNPGTYTFIVGLLNSHNTSTGAYSYQPVSQTTVNVYATDPTPQAGTQNGNDPADVGARYYLGLPVPDAGDYILIAQCSDGGTIFRNTQIPTNPYPISIPGIMSITGNSAFSSTDPNTYQRFYHFFYDMKLSLDGCASARVPVTASTAVAPVISLTGSTLSSSVATGNQWYLNSNPISGATGQTYTATQSGIYESIITSAMGCNSASNQITFGVTGIPDIDPAAIGMKVMPNPNDGRFTLDFTVSKKADLDITIVNAIGQKVYNSRTPGFIGHYTKPVDAGKLAPGVYLLQVQHDHKSYLKKLIVR